MKKLEKEVISELCRSIRTLLGWSQQTLSEKSSIGITTIQFLENAKREANESTVVLLQKTFAENGVTFTYDEEQDEITINYKRKRD